MDNCILKFKNNTIYNKEIFCAHRFRRLNFITTSILPNLIYRFDGIPTEIPAYSSVDINK